MKIIILTFLFFISSFISNAQNIILIFDTQIGQIQYVFLYNSTGIFKISTNGKINYIILGNFSNETNAIKTFNWYEQQDNIKTIATIDDDTKIYANQLLKIDYSNNYYDNQISKNFPSNINNYIFSYYDNYYDNEFIKGKLKQIGLTKFEYFSDYYLPNKIKGRIKQIGSIKFEYSNEYPYEEIQGLVTKIGNITIKYHTDTYKSYLTGKVEQIGNYKINYFDNYPDESHNGQFESITGTDSRFILSSQ